jgi:hypothetical protein
MLNIIPQCGQNLTYLEMNPVFHTLNKIRSRHVLILVKLVEAQYHASIFVCPKFW